MGDLTVMMVGPADQRVLDRVADEVFDGPPLPARVSEFLNDPRHHLAVALDGDTVVGFASGVHYVHPDKDPELWVNEVGVASARRGRGVGRAVLAELLRHGGALGCRTAWVLTEPDNAPALGLYRALGGVEFTPGTVMLSFDLGVDTGDG